MASRAVTRVERDDGVIVMTWQGIVGSADDGDSIGVADLVDLTVQCVGDFNSASVTVDLEGSNDNSTFGAMLDDGGSAITLGDSTVTIARGNPLYIKPNGSAGSGGDVDVIVTGKRYNA